MNTNALLQSTDLYVWFVVHLTFSVDFDSGLAGWATDGLSLDVKGVPMKTLSRQQPILLSQFLIFYGISRLEQLHIGAENIDSGNNSSSSSSFNVRSNERPPLHARTGWTDSGNNWQVK